MRNDSPLKFTDAFSQRHIGPRPADLEEMLKVAGHKSVDALIEKTIPSSIRMKSPLDLGEGLAESRSEFEVLEQIRTLAKLNRVDRSFIGMGYYGTLTPAVIQRNILENPGWYTQYTPYQAEIAQGRLEALLNFQTLVIDLTALPIANASLLDEATAAAEAMALTRAANSASHATDFFVSDRTHPQTLAVIETRAQPLGIRVIKGDVFKHDFASNPCFAAYVQYPDTDGRIEDFKALTAKLHAAGALVIAGTDLLALTLLTPPGEWGADVAVGSSQRLGVPMGFGGPHAAFLTTKDEYKRLMPGRLVGVSKDAEGRNAIRLALQTREQHIRRDKATSNICTAQVLLAIMASMYAVYHGPKGLRAIASRVHFLTEGLRLALQSAGYDTGDKPVFDTLCVKVNASERAAILKSAESAKILLRADRPDSLGVSLDEGTTEAELTLLAEAFASAKGQKSQQRTTQWVTQAQGKPHVAWKPEHVRTSEFLSHPVFNRYHSETEMLRYIRKLQGRDLSLAQSMIPLGSCTMKLNATVEMLPVTWPEFGAIHPFAPSSHTQGYQRLFADLERWLSAITGFSATSLQPNAGAQGEYAGLLVIRAYHRNRGQGARNICLIPKSAHGTNPASAAMAGMRVVVVECDSAGNVDLPDLRAKAQQHAPELAALMVTYPSTHGVFEESIREICEIVHAAGGQVYMDGANMNAQVGLCRPGDFGPDVCHLNLHKTFCIPHGGGGPGMGPIAVQKHLAPFLPSHPVVKTGGAQGVGAVSAAPWGSPSILPISWVYIAAMGAQGLTQATQFAILNANYIAKKLEAHYPVLYRGKNGTIAHECIFDLRPLKDATGIEVEDVAKRLMDYGYHAPTISFPVPGTLMVEPTESESKEELDRFCEAMIAIRAEIAEIEQGKADRTNNVLKHAPHTAEQVTRTEWNRPYSREKAAFPAPWVRENKFWPAVARINNVLGDRNLVCACPPMEAYL